MTLANCGAGSGKTLIAVLLLRHILDQELEDRAAGKKHRIAFFLVPSLFLEKSVGFPGSHRRWTPSH